MQRERSAIAADYQGTIFALGQARAQQAKLEKDIARLCERAAELEIAHALAPAPPTADKPAPKLVETKEEA